MWTEVKLAPLDDPKARVAFFGPASSGKTFLAEYLVKTRFAARYSFAGKLKAIAYELYGVTGKDGENRIMLHDLGDALRTFDNDVFTKYTLMQIQHSHPYDMVVIDDLRLPGEEKALRESGFFLIKVTTPDSVREERIRKAYPALAEGSWSHRTETSWLDIVPDAEIDSSDPSALFELDSILSGERIVGRGRR